MFNLDSSSSSTEEEGCFPGFGKVKIENGPPVTMFDLKIGDKVQIGIIKNIL